MPATANCKVRIVKNRDRLRAYVARYFHRHERLRLPTFREVARALRVSVPDVELLADEAELEIKIFGETMPMSDWEIEPPDPEPCCADSTRLDGPS